VSSAGRSALFWPRLVPSGLREMMTGALKSLGRRITRSLAGRHAGLPQQAPLRAPYFGQCALQPPRPSQPFLPAQSWDSGTAQPPRPRQGFLPMQQSSLRTATAGDFGVAGPGVGAAALGSLRAGAPELVNGRAGELLQLGVLMSPSAASAASAVASGARDLTSPFKELRPPRPG
jgi:hypothetical protein